MNATELQTRIKYLAYKLDVLCESFSRPESIQAFHDDNAQHSSLARDYTGQGGSERSDAIRSRMTTTLLEMGSTLFWISSIADLRLLRPAKLFSIIKEANELTKVLAPGILSSKKSEHK